MYAAQLRGCATAPTSSRAIDQLGIQGGASRDGHSGPGVLQHRAGAWGSCRETLSSLDTLKGRVRAEGQWFPTKC